MLPAELNAAAVLISYWSDVNPAVFIAVCLIVAVGINLGGTRAYGEVSRVDRKIGRFEISILVLIWCRWSSGLRSLKC